MLAFAVKAHFHRTALLFQQVFFVSQIRFLLSFHTMTDMEQGLAIDDNQAEKSFHQQKSFMGDCVSIVTSVVSGHRKHSLLAWLLLVLGAGVASAFLSLGLLDGKKDSQHSLDHSADHVANAIQSAWLQYQIVGLWAHQACHQLESSVGLANNLTKTRHIDNVLHLCSREEFRNLYEKTLTSGLSVSSLQYATKVENQYRQLLEDESREWLSHRYPTMPYQGITVRTPTDPEPIVFPAPDRDYYFPAHRLEPLEANHAVYDSDMLQSNQKVINKVLVTRKPSLSGPTRSTREQDALNVFLTHPGATISMLDSELPHSVVTIGVNIQDLLTQACRHVHHHRSVYVYNTTYANAYDFLGGIAVEQILNRCETPVMISTDETSYNGIPHSRNLSAFEVSIPVVDRQWTVVVVPMEGCHAAPNPIFTILGGAGIFVVFGLLALSVSKFLNHADLVGHIQTNAEMDKAEMYQKQAQRERRLNEYLA